MSQLSFPHSKFAETVNPLIVNDLELLPQGEQSVMEVNAVMVIDDGEVDVLPGRKLGRSSSTVWTWLTDDTYLQNAKSAKCKHCKMMVSHHNKSKSARTHLNSCAMFRTFMSGMNDDERPDWYRRKKKGGFSKTALNSQHGKSQASSTVHSSIKSFELPKVTGAMEQEVPTTNGAALLRDWHLVPTSGRHSSGACN